MGGPARLSRVDMARTVAATWGRSPAAIQPAPAASVCRGVSAPADISMSIERLEAALGVRTTALADALARIPTAPSGALPSCSLRQAQ
jgi:dTDP-4-dehydrorhamnose reductase